MTGPAPRHPWARTIRWGTARFRTDGPPQLTLITCGGAFDEATGNYADNVAVVAQPVA